MEGVGLTTCTQWLYNGYPIVLGLWFFCATVASVCTLQNLRATENRRRRSLFLSLQFVIIASYGVECLLLLGRMLKEQGWWPAQDDMIYLLASLTVWSVIQLFLLDSPKPVWYPYLGSWFLCFAAEAALLVSVAVSRDRQAEFDTFRLAWKAVRVSIAFSATAIPFISRASNTPVQDEETTRLLGETEAGTASYGSTGLGSASDTNEDDPKQKLRMRHREKLEADGNWWTYIKSFAIFWKYIWPQNERFLRVSLVMVGLCLCAERAIRVLAPRQLGIVTNALGEGNGIPWLELGLFILYKWLDSGSGIQNLQDYFWMPINQYAHKAISTAAYNHVMGLSYEYHTQRKPAEVWQAVQKGQSLNALIDMVFFATVPMFVDLCIAVGYLYFLFNAYMSLVVAIVSVTYLWTTIRLSLKRGKARRELNEAARAEGSHLMETLSSWTTVSYFNRVPYEEERFGKKVSDYRRAIRRWQIGISVMRVIQTLVFTTGLLAACFIAAYEISTGRKSVGSFVTLLTLWAQLQGPLGFFAGCFNQIQSLMLDAEQLLELFQTEPSVKESSTAVTLTDMKGEVIFDKVGFAYDPRKPAITDMSFHVPPGATVALVGETGGGKTTCLRLLFRFYDVQSGTIRIDGVDIRDIELSSLRDRMAVVPQDPTLFNDTILENLRYARLGASEEEIHEACRAAAIHDKIMSFPDGYRSKVGDRGIRLSGGELQRIAIARAILRDPRIILLDEATSMVDIETECQIQAAFTALAQNRTMFVVAHRLSTVMNADQILVIKGGAVIERGTHQQLLQEPNGYYRGLWQKQSSNGTEGSSKVETAPATNKGPVPVLEDDRLGVKSLNPRKEATTPNGTLQTEVQALVHPTAPINPRRHWVSQSLPDDRPSKIPQLYRRNPRLFPPPNSLLNGFLTQSTMKRVLALKEEAKKSDLKPEAQEFVPRTGVHADTTIPTSTIEPLNLPVTSGTVRRMSRAIEIRAPGPVMETPAPTISGPESVSTTESVFEDATRAQTVNPQNATSNTDPSDNADSTQARSERKRKRRPRKRANSQQNTDQTTEEGTNASWHEPTVKTNGIQKTNGHHALAVKKENGPVSNGYADKNRTGAATNGTAGFLGVLTTGGKTNLVVQCSTSLQPGNGKQEQQPLSRSACGSSRSSSGNENSKPKVGEKGTW